MSGDEVGVMLVAGVITLVLAIVWAISVFAAPRLVCPFAQRWPIWLMPLPCGAVLLAVLLTLAADDVRDAPEYIAMYMVLGAAWVGLARRFSPLFGLYPRQDIIERRNGPAGVAFAGLMMGLTLCYAGPNIGNGPGWWVVVFSAMLSTVTLLALWFLLDVLVELTDVVTIHRDWAAGLRLGAFFVAAGVILGRAAGGDWISTEVTVRDFGRMGWPVLVVFGAEVLISMVARPSAAQSQPPRVLAGVLPGMLYLLVAAANLQTLGVGR